MARTRIIAARFDDEGYETVLRAAEASGMPISSWASVKLLEASQPRRKTLLESLQEKTPAVLAVRANPDGETLTVTEDPRLNPRVVVLPEIGRWPPNPPDQIYYDGKIGTQAEHMADLALAVDPGVVEWMKQVNRDMAEIAMANPGPICEKCGYHYMRWVGTGDPGCPNCAMADSVEFPSSAPPAEVVDPVTPEPKTQCGEELVTPVLATPSGSLFNPKLNVAQQFEGIHERIAERVAARTPEEQKGWDELTAQVQEFCDQHVPVADVGTAPCCVLPPKRTWADEWDAMAKMDPGEAADRFRELQAGRKLPAGFKDWPKAQRITWLDRNWPL